MAFRAILSGLFLLVALPVQAQTLSIADSAALREALRGAARDQVVELAPGDYGTLALKEKTAPSVIRSADPANPARIGGLKINGVTDLALEGLHLGYAYDASDKISVRPFDIRDSRGITLSGNTIRGDVARGRSAADDGYGFGIGLSVRYSTDVRIEGNEISVWHRGMALRGSKNVVVAGNDLHAIRMDGMNFAQMDGVRIEGNHIHDFKRSIDSKDHADMIQFWTNRTEEPSRDITIRDNVLNSGDGWFTQSIFMRNDLVDRGLAGPEMFYRDVVIEDNVILNAHLHGITVGETDGLVIRRNTLIQNTRSVGKKPDRKLWIPRIQVQPASRDVQMTDNLAYSIKGYEGQKGWDVTGNLAIQNRSLMEPAHYSAVFADAMRGDPDRLASFAYRADGPAGRAGLGATRLRR